MLQTHPTHQEEISVALRYYTIRMDIPIQLHNLWNTHANDLGLQKRSSLMVKVYSSSATEQTNYKILIILGVNRLHKPKFMSKQENFF